MGSVSSRRFTMERQLKPFPLWLGPILLINVLLACAGLVILWHKWPASVPLGDDPTAKPRPIAPAGDFASDEKSRIEVFSRAKASVVNVSSAQFVRKRFDTDVHQVPKGTGTGFIWDEQGRVVTNYHVVKGA